MLPCACSLRSTHCAALIALATAAGIARIEPAQTTERSRPDFPECPPCSMVISPTPLRESAMWSLEPWFRLVQRLTRRSSVTVAAAHEDATPPALPTGIPCLPCTDSPTTTGAERWSLVLPARSESGLSAQEHSFPFAIGPPLPQASFDPRADGTRVPADSTARRKFASSALFSSFCFVARLARCEFAGHRLAGSSFHPGSALRGEPAFFAFPVRLPGTCVRRCAGIAPSRASGTILSLHPPS